MRRAVNAVYVHLLDKLEHHDDCGEKCVESCPVVTFHRKLAEPVLGFDIRQQERERERLKALLKGEIPKAV